MTKDKTMYTVSKTYILPEIHIIATFQFILI